MKKKKKSNKLRISADTIRKLSAKELDQAAGGLPPNTVGPTHFNFCSSATCSACTPINPTGPVLCG